MADQPQVDGHRMFVTEEDHAGRYGFCEICADHHDMVQYRLDGTGSFRPEVKCYPSHHAWRTWRKGQAIFRVPGV
jgi:hypothetical protein